MAGEVVVPKPPLLWCPAESGMPAMAGDFRLVTVAVVPPRATRCLFGSERGPRGETSVTWRPTRGSEGCVTHLRADCRFRSAASSSGVGGRFIVEVGS